MLDLFSIFSKGGIVLWCFQSTSQIFTPSVNALIRSVILQVRYLADYEFTSGFQSVLAAAEQWGKKQAKIPKQMRTFEDSLKSKKTVASMIERKNDEKENKNTAKIVEPPKFLAPELSAVNGKLDEETLMQNRLRLAQKLGGKSPKGKAEKQKSPKPAKEGKKPRVWDLGGNNKDLVNLERTRDKPADGVDHEDNIQPDTTMVGRMIGGIKDLEVESDSEEEEEEEEEITVVAQKQKSNATAGKGRSVFSIFKGLVGSKNLTQEDMFPVLERLKEHLITKNVASDIAHKLCESVAAKLEGKVLGTFDSVASTVKTTLTDALVQILSPRRRVDILRDAMEARKQSRPYVMSFCGVNGVGKSTNLAKICFWLIENNLRVLIAACDTFRAGAVEQLRTHTRHLNALHPLERHGGQQMVQLYEKGYGKDAAGIAMEAINFAKDQRIDVVLIDTAGRMQDNEPLMRALAKLIKVNQPDLVLFVGEALVGNEAVDQLVKFNQAMADYSSSVNPHLIDGIVLTKFDTIDDKVGAAISMTYITGQPIVFVGTGQTYTDLKSLNAKAVVHALMK
uniref:SRP54-type proteins GTP-binding domain-containing protein n=1 Tax=Timema tahoe TaxID=61484 RepID=A0A7R9FKQ0_9NEOP|nr:unnamed protein product [Timema tahoe]